MKRFRLVFATTILLALVMATLAVAGLGRVFVLHKPDTPAQARICVSLASVPGHLAHGDRTGFMPCPEPE